MESIRSGAPLTDDVRHDLRGTLAAIQALAELLEDEVSGPLNPAQADHVERILVNCGRLDQLIGMLRDT